MGGCRDLKRSWRLVCRGLECHVGETDFFLSFFFFFEYDTISRKLKTAKLTIQYFECLICMVHVDKISEDYKVYDHIFINSK